MIQRVLKRQYRLLVMIGCVTIIGIVSIFGFSFPDEIEFAARIKECNTIATEYRFSCYRSVLEKYYHGSLDDLKDWIKANKQVSFESKDASYAIFGTNCHTFQHAVGDFIAAKGDSKDLARLVSYCPLTCTSGCIMGLYKRSALENNYSSDMISSLYTFCPEESKHQCAHEIGHILHDKYIYSILNILDGISTDRYGMVLMPYQYKTFEDPDLHAPFMDCRNLVPEDVANCYTGVGHNMFLFAQFSEDKYNSSFRECGELTGQERDACYDFLIYRIGINDAATKFLSGKFEEGNRICNEIADAAKRKEARLHCFRGIGGGLGLFLDSEYSTIKITANTIGEIRGAVVERLGMCEEVEEEFIVECYKGLLGTRVKKLYIDLNLYNDVIEKILPEIKSDFEVVG